MRSGACFESSQPQYTGAMPEQGKHRITKLAFQRGITPEQVGGEAGERLKELFDTVDSSGRLSNEEMEEINRIIAEHTGAGGRSGLPAKTRGRARGSQRKED